MDGLDDVDESNGESRHGGKILSAEGSLRAPQSQIYTNSELFWKTM